MSIYPSRRLILLESLPPAPSSAPSPSIASLPQPSPESLSQPLHPDSSAYPSASAFHGPYMGVVLVVLLITFFLMAAFSLYVRRYALISGDAGADPSRRTRGLDPTAIEGLPIVVFHCSKDVSVKGEPKEDTSTKSDSATKAGESKEGASPAGHGHEWRRRADCVVCLTDFQEAECVRMLPRCEHCFHQECIDMWLFSHTTCPLCRRSLLPPTTAPLPPPPPPPPPSS